jgi:peroxygenase
MAPLPSHTTAVRSRNKVDIKQRHIDTNGNNNDHVDAPLSPAQRALNECEARHPHRPLTMLQRHVLFWDRDCDGIIWPTQIYSGFRELGFNILYSLGSLLIPIFFSYPTRLAHSWIPDPFFRIYVDSGNKSKHGSDSGIYTFDGDFNEARFEEMFRYFDRENKGALSADEMWALWKKNRCAWDVAGWCFAFMEWSTTWLLLQRDGLVDKADLLACYDGSLFWHIADARRSDPRGWEKGYGVRDFLRGAWKGWTWRTWELE